MISQPASTMITRFMDAKSELEACKPLQSYALMIKPLNSKTWFGWPLSPQILSPISLEPISNSAP